MFHKTKHDFDGMKAILDVNALLYTAEVATGALLQDILRQADEMLRDPEKVSGLQAGRMERAAVQLCTVAETAEVLRGALAWEGEHRRDIEFVRS